ncbi:hypothetical protein BHM03_00022175 [Ensete ventricosum]|nr:hypothetical protein BHM03_00022175 [Ensete ventricosum]
MASSNLPPRIIKVLLPVSRSVLRSPFFSLEISVEDLILSLCLFLSFLTSRSNRKRSDYSANRVICSISVFDFISVSFVAAPGISASPSEENMRYFNVMILGPAQSPYEGSLLVDVFLWMFSTQINLVQHLLVFLCAYLGFLTSVEVGLYWEALPP